MSAFLRCAAIVPFVWMLARASGPLHQATNSLANVEVLIIRHAERDGAQDSLTEDGVARAAAYAHFFKPLEIDGRSIHLTHLIAEQSDRTQNTLLPTAKALKMPLDTRFATGQMSKLVADLKTHSYGNEILICWHHSKMAKLIMAFGGDPAALLPGGKWPDTTFDWIVDLRFDAAGNLLPANEKLVHEHLMPGDSE